MNGNKSGIFDEIFVQPASGDSESVWRMLLALKPALDMSPFVLDITLASMVRSRNSPLRNQCLRLRNQRTSDWVARQLAEGHIVGCSGAFEFGPRALGNRSILTRPFPAQMKDTPMPG